MKLPAVKARIVAAMRTNRECDAEWLFEHVFGRRKRRPKRANLKVHIYQLRRMGYPITGMARGRHPARYEWSDEKPQEGRGEGQRPASQTHGPTTKSP